MMNRSLLTTIASIFLMGTIACQKKEEVAVQPDKVVVNITSPKEGQVVRKGETLSIVANIRYITQMHGYIIKIVNQETGKLYYETEGHAHGDIININEQWTDSIATQTPLQLEITAVLDHEQNETHEKLGFISQP
ncbi:MAG: hypothetical protein R2800_15140 [Flavipsychrobacter sp.]